MGKIKEPRSSFDDRVFADWVSRVSKQVDGDFATTDVLAMVAMMPQLGGQIQQLKRRIDDLEARIGLAR